MKTIKLFNTFTREIEELKPIEADLVKIYCCGPTVYNYQHIGNFRTFISEDILRRSILLAGYKVKHVMNITDVGHLVSDGDSGEDKMLVAAKREKKKSYEIADFYTKIFFTDWEKLNLLMPDIVCKASEHIQEMLNLIQNLVEKDFAYFSNGNIYFDISKFADYGKLAKLNIEDLKAGARIEQDPHKRNPGDFVLWFTKSKFENHELQWDSPWGSGYPGWHIECSAMSMKYLGESFDIHCGGIDHIPVHHTNEIAQSEAATGKKYANIWMHCDFALIDDQKISKSAGKFVQITDLVNDGYHPLAYKMLALGTHYRKPLNFNKVSMDNAARNLQKLFSAVTKLKIEANNQVGKLSSKYEDDFKKAILNDLNTPQSLAVLWELLSDDKLSAADKLSTLYLFDQVFGFDLENYQELKEEIPAAVKTLAEKRAQARADKNWKESDLLRDEIAKLGFLVEDKPDGQKISKK